MEQEWEDYYAQEEDEDTRIGELGRLADELLQQEGIDASDIFDAFVEWTAKQGIELWPHQEEALFSLMAGDHVILGTPTGSGKSMVALGLHFLALSTDQVCYYTAPIKALVSEKFFELVRILGRDYVGMITGDTSINASAPIICCTEEILANQALREGAETDVRYVAMDEFHYYADPQRGWAWQVPLLTLPNTQFLLMSATLGDTTPIQAQLKEHTNASVSLVLDAPRPVPLSFDYVDTSIEGTVELALRRKEAPLYIVHFAQDAALKTAKSLACFTIADKEQRQAIKNAMKGTNFNTAFGKMLSRLLACGVGVHHAGMLPRYRLLVEKLTQEGLLPVICGTDTLGVGINVPIHTVLLTSLTKYDGTKQRRLNAREFHQIAGRAGRAGFDTEGLVLAEAPEHEIENAKLRLKAGGDPKKLRKLKLKKAPDNFVSWNKKTLERLVAATPEPLKPRMKASHSMALALVERGGNAQEAMLDLIDASAQTDKEKARLKLRTQEIFTTLLAAGVIEREHLDDGTWDYFLMMDLPDDFVLDQPLSPFLLAALELLDPESEEYALDVVSMVEAIAEDPRQILRSQEHKARNEAWAQMRADGVDVEERKEKLEDITYPKPLNDLLTSAFAMYCKEVPWASDHEISPKSVLREMLEGGETFKSYIAACGVPNAEGILLRYLSDVYRILARTIPPAKRNDQLDDITAWLRTLVHIVDSSLVDEWEHAGEEGELEAFESQEAVVHDRHGLEVLVRNALWQRIRFMAQDDAEALGRLDVDWGYNRLQWQRVLDAFYDVHEDIILDADARSATYFTIDDSDEREMKVWHVMQLVCDTDEDHDFRLVGDVDLIATQNEGEVIFSSFQAGSFDALHSEELL